MPIHTALYASLSALLLIFLAANVALKRRKLRIGIGSKGNKEMAQTIRLHANAVEYVPLTLILLLLAELLQAPSWMLHLAGVSLVLARVLHAIGLSSSIGISFGRFYGTAINWLLIIGLAVFNISQSFSSFV